jgi:hypothetical protein
LPTHSPDPLASVRVLLGSAEADGTTPRDAEALTAKTVGLLAQYGLDCARFPARQARTSCYECHSRR